MARSKQAQINKHGSKFVRIKMSEVAESLFKLCPSYASELKFAFNFFWKRILADKANEDKL